MKRNAEFLAEYISIATGIKTSLDTETQDENAIILSTGLESDNSEAYKIVVNSKAITVKGASEAGVFYGIQTLRKATPIDRVGSVLYSAATINDEPRFAYRGMSLDIARHFQPVEFIKKYIDMLALHNVNRFHWHLTDDQGWRIEIDSYPGLTEVGSMRSETVIGRNSGEYDGTPHGGYYTKEELKEVVEYARERYITVIPEVDLPGHMLAALTAYPESGCTGGPYKVVGEWGVFDDILCAGKEESFEFLEAVLTEVMEIFPSELIHIPQLISLYEKLNYNYATHVFDVKGEFNPNFKKNVLDVVFSTIDDADVYYTTDGSDPSESSIKYDGLFSIDQDTELKAVAIRNGVKSKMLDETI